MIILYYDRFEFKLEYRDFYYLVHIFENQKLHKIKIECNSLSNVQSSLTSNPLWLSSAKEIVVSFKSIMI